MRAPTARVSSFDRTVPIDSVLLCANVLHGRAIDIALAWSRTETVVVLDVEACSPVS